MGLGTVILILVGIWYLGGTINSLLAGSGELVSKEFNQFKQEQDVRIHKSRIKRAKAVDKFSGEKVYTDREWENIFNPKDEE